MPINFPLNPNPGDIYSFGDRNWEYTGKGWRLLSQISLANSAFNKANSSFITANAAFDAANGAIAVNLTQNTSITAAFVAANSAGVYANGAFAAANNEAGVNLTQNTNITTAQAKADSAFDQANAAFIQANTNAGNITTIQGVNLTQNTSISDLQAVNVTQNNRITYAENHANAAFLAANNATDTYVRNHANSAFDHANAAYAQANTNTGDITVIQGVNLTQNTNTTNAQNSASAAFDQANSAYFQANTNSIAINVIQGIINGQNTTISNIEGVNLTQNTNITNAQNSADAAFVRANNSLNANAGGIITGPVTIAANLTITGNLTVIGNTITTDIQSLNIGDPLIYLAANNYSGDAVEIGFAANYYDGSTSRHTGVFREASNKEYYIFDNYTPEPDANLIDTSDPSFRVATVNANLKSQLITLNGQNLQTYVDNAYNTANAAFGSANNINGVNLTQNTNIINIHNKANSAFDKANAAYDQANANYDQIVVIMAVDVTQNNSIASAFIQANAAFNAANNATDTFVRAHANAAFDQANSAYTQANTNAGNITVIQGVNLTQNNNISNLEAVNLTQNTNISNIQGVDNTQNNRITYAENHANAAFNQANSAGIVIAVDAFTGTGSCTTFALSTTPSNENFTIVTVSGVTQAKTTYSLSGGNLVFSEAPPNTANIEVIIFTASGGSFLAYNDNFTGTGACTTFTLTTAPTNENYTIVSVSGVIQHKSTYSLSGADIVFSEAPPNSATIDATYFVASTLLDSSLTVYAANHANAAFLAANNATDTYVRSHANSAFHQANAAYSQANTNATNITIIQGVNDRQNNEITYAENHANAAFIRANNSLNANTGGTIGGDVSITGNLTVLGNTFSVSSSQIVANDTMFILGVGNYTGDVLDIGFSSHYNAGVNAHTGLIRDSGTKEWQLFEGYTPEVGANNNININDPSFKIATLNANLHSTYIQLNGQNLQTYVDGAYNTANSAGKTIVLFSDSPPAGPTNNTLWWQSNTGVLKVWYTDIDGSQWVDASPVAPTSSLLISDDVSSAITIYPIFTSNTTGALSNVTISSTKLTFNPSTGIITSTGFNGSLNGSVGATTPATGFFTTLSSSGATTFTAGTASTSNGTGTVVITGGLGVSGNIFAGQSVSAVDLLSTSDKSLKKNIKTIKDPLNIIENLRGVNFKWKKDNKDAIGVIAQEVEKILPEVVSTDDKGIKTVSYGNIVGLLIEAIKEQQKQIDELKRKINAN